MAFAPIWCDSSDFIHEELLPQVDSKHPTKFNSQSFIQNPPHRIGRWRLPDQKIVWIIIMQSLALYLSCKGFFLVAKQIDTNLVLPMNFTETNAFIVLNQIDSNSAATRQFQWSSLQRARFNRGKGSICGWLSINFKAIHTKKLSTIGYIPPGGLNFFKSPS